MTMYIVLPDDKSQERSDERRHDMLMDQDARIRETFRKRLGAMSERTPKQRKAFYEAHQPVFVQVSAGVIETVTLDEWLEAVDNDEKRAVLLAKWEGIIPTLLDSMPPEGAPQLGDEIDPATGQPVMVDPGQPNYELRQQLWMSMRERVMTQGVTNRLQDLGCLLMPFYRERFTYYPRRIVKELRDMRRLMKGDDEPVVEDVAPPVPDEVYA